MVVGGYGWLWVDFEVVGDGCGWLSDFVDDFG